MSWAVETLNAAVDRELDALAADQKARSLRIAELIEAKGIDRVREPYVRHIEGRLSEMRMTGRDGIARALYVTAAGRRVVVVRLFVKKTRKTPRREIRLALERAKEVG
jgi:phage-related protein